MQVHLPAAHLQKKSEAEKTLRDMALWHWGDKRSEWALFQFQQQRHIMMTHAVSFSSNGHKHRESHSKCCMKIWRLWTTQIHRGCTIWSTYISLELRPASLSIDPRCACRPRCLDKWPCWDVDVWRSCGRLLYPVPSISIRHSCYQYLLLGCRLCKCAAEDSGRADQGCWETENVRYWDVLRYC